MFNSVKLMFLTTTVVSQILGTKPSKVELEIIDETRAEETLIMQKQRVHAFNELKDYELNNDQKGQLTLQYAKDLKLVDLHKSAKTLSEENKKIREQKEAEAKKQEEERLKKEAQEKAEREKREAEQAKQRLAQQQAVQQAQPTQTQPQQIVNPPASGDIQFGADGLLVMQASDRAQSVVNGLLGIPGHSNGQWYHDNGLDYEINQLSTAEAFWVLWRIEGAGFGQTGDGYAGYDTPVSHSAVVTNQVNRRFGGSIHALLRAWGTFSYGGY